MTAIIYHEVRHDHLALVFAERDRLGMWKPTPFVFSPRVAVARQGQDRSSGLDAHHDRTSRQGAPTADRSFT